MKLLNKIIITFLLVAALLSIPVNVIAAPVVPQAGGSQGTKFITNDTYTLSGGQTLDGALLAIDSTVTLDANSIVTGTIVMLGGKISAAGRIEGSLVCLNCSGNVLDSAVIVGSIVNPGNSLIVSAKAVITGSNVSGGVASGTQTVTPAPSQTSRQGEIGLVSRILGGLFVVLALSALGVLVALLFPRATEKVAHATTANPGISWGVGILSVFVVFIGMLILTITIVLIPVAALALLLLGFAALFGWIGLGHQIGSRIAAASNQKWTDPVSTGVGLLIMNVIMVGFIIIPSWVGSCISSILIFVVSMFGLGAVVLTRFGSHVYPEPPPMPPAAAMQANPIPPAAPSIPVEPSELKKQDSLESSKPPLVKKTKK